MDRRLIGALLLVAAMATAIAVPMSSGRRIAGSAAMVELPADPRVGDCLLTPPDGVWMSAVGGPAQAAQAPTRLSSDSARPPEVFGPCQGGGVAGEVTAVIPTGGDQEIRKLQAEPGGFTCRASALKYAGLAAQDAGRYTLPDPSGADPVVWKFSINLRSGWLVPGPVLRAAGRTWAACVAMAPSSDLYKGRLLGSYAGGRLPDAFGACWNTPRVSAAILPVACGASHPAELISVGTVTDPRSTRLDIQSSCTRMAAQVMGRADPTGGGSLRVKVYPDDKAPRMGWPLDIVCYIVPMQRALAGTLVGLRDRPIPYSS